MVKLANNVIENGKLSIFFKPRRTDYPMELRYPDYRTTIANTEKVFEVKYTTYAKTIEY